MFNRSKRFVYDYTLEISFEHEHELNPKCTFVFNLHHQHIHSPSIIQDCKLYDKIEIKIILIIPVCAYRAVGICSELQNLINQPPVTSVSVEWTHILRHFIKNTSIWLAENLSKSNLRLWLNWFEFVNPYFEISAPVKEKNLIASRSAAINKWSKTNI